MHSSSSLVPRRRRRSAAEIAAIVQQYRQGELTQRELAQQHGVCAGTIQNWLRREMGVHSQAVSPSAWIELVPEKPSSVSSYRIEFPQGPVLVLNAGWKAAEVRELARALSIP